MANMHVSRATESDKTADEDDDDIKELLASTLDDFSNPDLLKPAVEALKQSSSTTATEKVSTPKEKGDNAAEADRVLEAMLQNFENLFSGAGMADGAGHNVNAPVDEIMSQLENSLSQIDSTVQDLLAPSPDDSRDPEVLSLKSELRRLSAKVDAVQDDASGVRELSQTLQETLRNLNMIPEAGDTNVPTPSTSGNDVENENEVFAPFMEGMMRQLLSRELLYPPLKSMVNRYPAWLKTNCDSLSADERRRYTDQLSLMRLVVEEYEKESSSTDKQSQFQRLLGLVQQMQELGQPPEDLVGDGENLPPVLGGSDFGMGPNSCPTM